MIPPKRHSSAKAPQSSTLSSTKDKVLLGSRVRVWWPLDKKFYEGVVEAYSSSRRKHRVLYDDGDEEYLVMKNERWELIEDDEDDVAEEISSDEDAADDSSDATPEPKKNRSTGKSTGKKRVEAARPKKKLKTDSSAKSIITRSGRQTPKASKVNGRLGDIGGKIVAAASRMSMRSQKKQNGQAKPIAEDEDSSDDDSETLMNFMKRLKGKKEEEEGSESGEEESEENSENESGEDSSDSEAEEASEGEEGSEGSEGSQGLVESSGNESD